MMLGHNLLSLADAGIGYLWDSPAGDIDQPLRTQASARAALYDTAGARGWPVADTDAISSSITSAWPVGASGVAAMLDQSGLPGAASLAAAYRTAVGAAQPDTNLDVLLDAGKASAEDARKAGEAAGKAVGSGAVGAVALLLALSLFKR